MTITRHAVGAQMTLPTYYAPVSSVPMYSTSFDSGVAGWSPSIGGVTVTQVYTPALSSYEMQVSWNGVGGPVPGVGNALGLVTVPGKVYQLTATARTDGAAQARVAFGNSGGGLVLAGGGWVVLGATPKRVSVILRAGATGTSMNPLLDHGAIGLTTGVPVTVYWDDVVMSEMAELTALDLRPESASVTLDESWSPYVRASITCPLPAADALPKIDPRVMNRVRLLLSQADLESRTAAYLTSLYAGKTATYLTTTYAGKTAAWLTDLFGDQYNAVTDLTRNQRRTMDLMLRTRSLDYVAGTMTLELTSDEILLQDFVRPESASGVFVPPTTHSLRAMVNWGLGFIGASLTPTETTDYYIFPEQVIFQVGDSIWEFLDAFVRANNLRLWSDERRVWHLTPPQTGAAGTANLRSVVELGDTLTRDDPGYGDATVILYTWTDAAGLTQSAYGNYYLPTMQYPKMFVQRFNSPNTGVIGSPATVLRDRTITRGRAVTVQAVSDYTVTPGQSATISTPVTTVTGAMVSAVTWQWPQDEMNIRTRDAS